MKDKIVSLFQEYATNQKYGREAVLQYIQEQTDVVPRVVEDFIAGRRLIVSGSQKRIFGCLRHARPEDFQRKLKLPQAPSRAEAPQKQAELVSPPPAPAPPPPPRIRTPRKLSRREETLLLNKEQLRIILGNLRSRGIRCPALEEEVE